MSNSPRLAKLREAYLGFRLKKYTALKVLQKPLIYSSAVSYTTPVGVVMYSIQFLG